MPKILLVDDVALFLQLESSYLDGSGYELLTAASGEETLQRIERIAPDMIVLDYHMPGINGDEVCRAIRKNPAWEKLPILMVTAAGKGDEVAKCLGAGCDDYITKPVNKEELQEKVARLLGQLKRRTSERIRVRIPVQLRHDGQLSMATTQDLSRNGMFLHPGVAMDENATVELQLPGVAGNPLSLFGKIKRTEDNGHGVYLICPDQQSQHQLDELLSAKRTEQLADSCISDDLMRRLQALEQECSRLRDEQDEAKRRIGELEQENLEFANQLVQVEEVNSNLTNLYLASSRLHSTLDRAETLEIIKEVVINFVGAEKFAIFLYDRTAGKLHFETGEGFDEDEPVADIAFGEGVLGQVVCNEQNYFAEKQLQEGSDDVASPVIAIPLLIHDKLIGVLAIYRLFIQKEQLESIDYQLFSMLGEHTATALFSSTLYSRSERKRQTYEGVVDLLLK